MNAGTNEKASEQVSERGASLTESTDDILHQGLWWKILLGMVAGIILGTLLSPETGLLEGVISIDLAYGIGEWASLVGVIFLALIQMVIIPLIVCSIIVGIVDSGSLEVVKKMGLRIIPYFILTTAVAITIGLSLVTIIQPGNSMDADLVSRAMESGAMAGRIPDQTFSDLSFAQRIQNILPDNLTEARLERDMLPIVIAAILIAIAMLSVQARVVRPFYDLCVAGQILTMKIISWAMVIAPYAVFGLLTNITIRLGMDAVESVGLYMLTVLLGLLAMVVVYLLIVAVVSRMNPLVFLARIREVQLLAFSTSSSGATIPFSIKAAEEKLDIRPSISRFTVPLGATINMDGTAMYQAIAAVFLCQVFQIDLTLQEMILLMVTTVGASIGTPATPGVGIIVLATILIQFGVPVEGLALILGVDRILDMCRTTVNVTGDLTATTVLNCLVKPEKQTAVARGY